MRHLRKLLTAAFVLTAIVAMAVPAKRDLRTVRQPDGTELTLRLVGDEFNHFYLTDDDRMVIATDGGYYFAQDDAAGNVVASKVLAADAAHRNAIQRDFVAGLDQQKLLQSKSQQTATRMRAPQRTISQSGVGLFPGTNPQHTGSPHFLVILVQYKDVKFNTSYTTDAKTYFTNMLRQQGFKEYSGTGSAYDFFNQASKGQFTPEFDVYGPVTLANNRSYYGGNDSKGNDLRPEEMVTEACSALNSQIDFSQYDTDGDGYVDNVFVFYAGQGEASYGPDESVWPHAWYVKSGAGVNLCLDGKYIDRYGCTNEWNSGRPDGVGTFVHEFSHVLGLPDLYVTDYSSASALTPGAWDVMDYGPYNNNGCTPPTYSIYERNAMGWMEPVTLKAGEGRSISLENIFDSNTGYIIPVSTNEFFLLENRQKTGWDAYVPGHGMLIWHIDYNSTIWNQNKPNNSATHQYVDIEEASGTADNTSSTAMAKYPFPGTSRVTSFNKFTSWAGNTLNFPLTNIKESSGVVSFDVCGGAITVNAPTVSAASGTYSQPVTLSITKDNASDEVEYLIITDTEEMFEGTYTSPLTIDTPADFSCWATRSGVQSSEVERRFDFKAATPVITPASASVSAMPEVSISCASPDVNIYYTLDGSTPTVGNGTLYSAPFTPAAATVTIKAVAVRAAWQSSDVAQVTYTYTAPVEQHSGLATYNLYHVWEQEGQSGWTTSYSAHKVSYTEGEISMNVNQPASNASITDYPVTKGSNVIVTMNDGYTPIKGVYLKAGQWGSKAQTITLAYSTNGTSWTTIDGANSSNFELLCNAIPDGAVAVKFMFSSSSNQVGLQEIRVSYGPDGEPIVIDPVTPPVTEPVDPQLAWSGDAATVTIGANDNVFPTLTAPEGLAISYSSSDTDVATIDADGTVTLVAAGSTVITAANEATADYIASSVTYTLTVKPASTTPGEPEEPVYEDITATFDFTGDSAYEMELMSGNDSAYNPNPYSFSENEIMMALSGNTRWWRATAGNELRFYKDAGFTITAPENHKIVKVELVGATPANWDTDLNEYSNGIWTGNADAVKFSTNIDKGNTAIKKVKVELLAVPNFNMANLNYRHADDKSVTLHCTLAHSNYGHVKHYEIWVIDQTPAGAVQLMSMEGENVVGHVLVGATDFASDSFNVEVPLQLAADSGIHHLEVRAQAVLRDNSTQYADTFSDEGEEANVGDTGTDVDTSVSGTITTGATIINVDSDTTTEYFTLQGVRVVNPAPGIYIRRNGSTVTKVVVR